MSYLHGHHATVLSSHLWRTAENSAAYLLDRLRPGRTLLDVGCGPGTITADLAERVAPGTVTGIDSNPGVLEQAERTARERGLTNVEYAVADVFALDFPDDSFDVVHAHQLMQHLPDPVRALRELRRVCRPGGVLLATVPAYQGLWSMHDVANHHYRRYSRSRLRDAAQAAGWRLRLMTSFNGLLLGPAAVVRLAERRRMGDGRGVDGPGSDYQPELRVGPQWLNAMLEQPLALEARWLARGHTIPAGLSLLAVLENSAAG